MCNCSTYKQSRLIGWICLCLEAERTERDDRWQADLKLT